MFNSIDDIPIRLSNETSQRSGARSWIIYLAVAIAFFSAIYLVVWLIAQKWYISIVFIIGLLVIFEIIAVILFIINPGVIRLLIDQSGVHLSSNDREISYEWADIDRVDKVSETHTARTQVISVAFLEIRRKGELVHGPKSDRIPQGMGLSVDTIKSIIEEGRARWGSG